MLQIKNITKKYVTGSLTQTALDGVSLNLRDNEFVAILGPSGSGKTTLLNIIGGLDRYDSGDLVIGGVSTKQYRDRDWDSYRNHTVGFVFQSYNLIPHQSVLSNVELALTISGVPRVERRRRAKAALEQVGLSEHIHKRPNQMSGGQMQRVAIARALVNDPDILLADEPTGALDTETSVQVMELLKQVAKDRLVVMVTHNPELAEQYATRTVRLRDGKITGDSDPYEVDESAIPAPEHRNMGKSSMSLMTSLLLSFNNLRTKKGRTILTAFAGSIGIIGIALILSLSNGVNSYIEDIQKDTMTSYPITIQAQTIDLSSILENAGPQNRTESAGEHEQDAVYSDPRLLELAAAFSSSVTQNNLTAFKKYLDDPTSKINEYIGENGIIYSYDTKFEIYARDPGGELLNTDGSTLEPESPNQRFSMTAGMGTAFGASRSSFRELLPGQNGDPVSPALKQSYEVLYGRWPEKYDEMVLVLNSHNEIAASTLYQLGYLPADEYRELMRELSDGEELNIGLQRLTYEQICAQTFYLLPACDMYTENEDGTFTYVGDDDTQIETLVEEARQLRIVGVIRPESDGDSNLISGAVGYTRLLTDTLIEASDNSPVVLAQRESPDVNVLNGLAFAPADDDSKIEDTKLYLASLNLSEKAQLMQALLFSGAVDAEALMQRAQQPTDNAPEYNPGVLPDGYDPTQIPEGYDPTQMAEGYDPTAVGEGADPAAQTMDPAQMQSAGEAQLAAMLDLYLEEPDEEVLLSFYDREISTGTYDGNLSDFGVVSLDAPSSISLYADSFEAKDGIADCIKAYNETVTEENQINYTDYVGLLMSSVTTIINVISYVLIAFVAVSLIVSSIMIGIITYISVLERTKEIGILRAIGASKRNISQVFNAETFIIGLLAGVLGIAVTLLLLIPMNAIIHALTGSVNVNASLPPVGAVILVVLSVILTLIGGLIPSKKAARKDPVAALRTE